MAKHNRNKVNLVQEKASRLSFLNAQAEATLSTVRSQITSLNQINEAINKELGEIDEYISDLTRTREGLSAEADRNKQVAANFAKLLCLE